MFILVLHDQGSILRHQLSFCKDVLKYVLESVFSTMNFCLRLVLNRTFNHSYVRNYTAFDSLLIAKSRWAMSQHLSNLKKSEVTCNFELRKYIFEDRPVIKGWVAHSRCRNIGGSRNSNVLTGQIYDFRICEKAIPSICLKKEKKKKKKTVGIIASSFAINFWQMR